MRVWKRNDSWYMDFTHQGRRIRRKISGARTKAQAQAALVAVQSDIFRGEFNFKNEKPIIFEAFAKEYLKYAKTNKKSWRSDQTSLNHLIPNFKGIPLNKITPKLIEQYKTKRVETMAPASVNRELACLKYMYTLAIRWDYVDENPVKKVNLFRERKTEMQIMDREDVDRLLENSPEYLHPIIIVAINTGMRKSEILKLEWKNVDFNLRYFYIHETKSGRPRKVPMNDLVYDTLRNRRNSSPFVFLNPLTGSHITDIKKAFTTAREKAGLPKLRFHDLRHTAATYMVIGGVDLITVAEILGHSDIKMTMRYAHPTPENRQKAVAVLAAVFGGESEKSSDDDPDRTSVKDQIAIYHLISVN